MENNTKQHVLVFDKGVTNAPGDLVCSDDSLEVCDGLTMVDGEWKVVQDAKSAGTLDAKILLVHETTYGKHYVTTSSPCAGAVEATAVGNTLICKKETIKENGESDYSLEYYLCTGKNTYSYLGDRLPEVEVDFSMYVKTAGGGYNFRERATFPLDSVSGSTVKVTEDNANAFEDCIHGLYAKLNDDIDKEGYFNSPFFVVYALELTDGSYAHISQPILMYPSTKEGTIISFDKDNSEIAIYTLAKKLQYKVTKNIPNGWKDIIKNIVVFASQGINTYDVDNISKGGRGVSGGKTSFNMYTASGEGGGIYRYDFGTSLQSDVSKFKSYGSTGDILPFESLGDADILKKLSEVSVFYKIFEAGNTVMETWENAPIERHTLENLTTQDRLDTLDYYSHTNIVPGKMYTFNRRLNAIDCTRSFFEGFKFFMAWDLGFANEMSYQVQVFIDTPTGEKFVEYQFRSKSRFDERMWFFYPDPRAKRFLVRYWDGEHYTNLFLDEKGVPKTLELKEHRGLNGAYYVGTVLPHDNNTIMLNQTNAPSEEKTIYPLPESLDNYLLQSEVDNPFTFNASGYHRVGQGEIIGLAGLTTALNQDMYKVATTLAFTTQGIWALKIDGTGQYAEVAPPFSREVCSNADSITMTDNTVFFASKKGLMRVVDTSERGVICVSEVMKNSKAFIDDVQNSLIAYDYRDSLLFVIPKDKDSSEKYAWVYNIVSKVWSKKEKFPSDVGMLTVVNDYPDTIIQDKEWSLYSLLNKPHREDDPLTYSVEMTSRPLKLDGSMILKSLRRLKVLKTMEGAQQRTAGNEVTIWGSNDLYKWVQLDSLAGAPFKFFKISLSGTMKATDSIAGVVVVTQSRYTDRIR